MGLCLKRGSYDQNSVRTCVGLSQRFNKNSEKYETGAQAHWQYHLSPGRTSESSASTKTLPQFPQNNTDLGQQYEVPANKGFHYCSQDVSAAARLLSPLLQSGRSDLLSKKEGSLKWLAKANPIESLRNKYSHSFSERETMVLRF